MHSKMKQVTFIILSILLIAMAANAQIYDRVQTWQDIELDYEVDTVAPQADGDSIIIQEFDRGIQQIRFVPKGQWITGVSVSFSQSDQKNYKFLILEGINGDTYSFKITPMLMYAFADNMAAGGKFAYSRQRTRLNEASVKIDSETGYDVENLFSISHTYYAMAAFRNYISFGNNTRFGMFAEAQLQFSGGESKLCNGIGEDLTGTFERTYGINVGIAPGMMMFLNNYSAIEVNVGVIGFNYSHTRSVTDRVYIANRSMQSASFSVNLFSITFGVVFYL